MYTVHLDNVRSTELNGDNVYLNCKMYIDERVGTIDIWVRIFATSVHVGTLLSCDEYAPYITVSDSVVHAARLFGKMLR